MYYNRTSKRWKSEVQVAGEKYRIGSFGSEVDAARAYDRFVLSRGFETVRPLNFPLTGAGGGAIHELGRGGKSAKRTRSGARTESQRSQQQPHRLPPPSQPFSFFPGVTWDARKAQWRIVLVATGKRTRTRYFDDECDAGEFLFYI